MFHQHHSPPAGAVRRLFALPVAQAALYLLLAAVVMGLAVVRLWDVFSLLPEDGPPPWWLLTIPFASCLLVLLKRRAPLIGLIIAIVLFVFDLFTIGSIVTILILLEMLHAFTVTLTAEGRRRVLFALFVSVVVLVGLAWLLSHDPQLTFMVGLQFGALLGFTYWYANSVAQSRELVELYRQRAEDAARLAELDRESTVRGERERMARELHDVVAGHVAAVAIRSEAVLSGASPNGDSRGAEAVTAASEIMGEAVERRALRAVRDASLAAHSELRSMIAVLRDSETRAREEFVLSRGRGSVAGLVEEANHSGLTVSFWDELDDEVATATDQAIGRIVQEALANAARHSSGARVGVRLSGDDERVEVEVLSRGGASLKRLGLTGNAMGLELLVERASALGGRLVAGPEPDPENPSASLWAVRATLPRKDES